MTQQREDNVDRSEHRGRSIQNAQTSHTLSMTFANGWLRWAGAPKCVRVDSHRAQISKEFFDQAERIGISVDLVLAEAHWRMGSRQPCEISSHDEETNNGRPGF